MSVLYCATAACILAAVSIAQPAAALKDERLNRQLLMLDTDARLEQTCDTEVAMRINSEQKAYSVDKVIAYALHDVAIEGTSIKAVGAAFRSKGTWYKLSFACTTGPRRLDAHALDYQIGAKIPRSEWDRYYLYD